MTIKLSCFFPFIIYYYFFNTIFLVIGKLIQTLHKLSNKQTEINHHRMKKLLLLFMLGFILFASSAQQNSIKGIVTDTLNKQKLKNVVVSLLRYNDSVLYRFTRTNEKGEFELNNLKTGKYVMLLTYPTYAPMMDSMNVTDNSHQELNNLVLITKAQILKEVIVERKIAPIRFKGDTLEIIADSFKLKAGATVEDLIKKFPGFTVDSKGNITAQGQKVEKVLVDGDEFFGDDPTLATQNLSAKDVVKVQLFDKKSDQAALTGIDDGQKQKTMNLVLKDDAKKGYFGKAEAGTDFSDHYQAKGTFNRFTSTMKTGAYVSADRTGNNDMSWNEMQDFSSNLTTTIDGNNIMMSYEGDGFQSWGLQGLPENLVTALMFNQKFGKLKSSTASNFSFKHQNIVGDATTNSTYILPDTVYYNNQTTHFTGTKWRHALSTKNEFNLDSLNTINVNAGGNLGYNQSQNIFNSTYLSAAKDTVNTNNRTTTSTTNSNAQKLDVFYKHKFNKTGTRMLTLNGGIYNSVNDGNGYLYSLTNFYKNGIVDSTVLIDQKKLNSNTSTTYQGLISYTEPLTKKLSLNLNYSFFSNNSSQNIQSFDKQNGSYSLLDTLYSNHFKFINTSSKGGFVFNYNGKKLTAKLGLGIQNLAMKETNLYKDSSFNKTFVNYFPTVSISWKPSGERRFYLSYDGRTQQPSLNQIQPIANNTDPLNINIGNQNLKPSVVHSFSFNGGDSKVLSNRYIGLYGNFSLTQNAFSSETKVDSLGRRTNQTVNVNGNFYYYAQIYYQKKIKFWGLSISFVPNINGNRNNSYVNGVYNTTNSTNLGSRLGIDKTIEKKLDFYLAYNPQFSHSTSTINTSTKTDYWTHTINNYFSYRFKKGINLNSNIEANFRQKLYSTDVNNNNVVWDASLEKKLLKKQDVWLVFSVNDILNQKKGVDRSISSNFISENTYTTVKRYFLVTLRWKFAKNRKTDDDE